MCINFICYMFSKTCLPRRLKVIEVCSAWVVYIATDMVSIVKLLVLLFVVIAVSMNSYHGSAMTVNYTFTEKCYNSQIIKVNLRYGAKMGPKNCVQELCSGKQLHQAPFIYICIYICS